jgi:hypothetical protein
MYKTESPTVRSVGWSVDCVRNVVRNLFARITALISSLPVFATNSIPDQYASPRGPLRDPGTAPQTPIYDVTL